MDAQALRAMQAPIKDRYKDDPKAAFITLKARGTLDDTHIACKVETGRAQGGRRRVARHILVNRPFHLHHGQDRGGATRAFRQMLLDRSLLRFSINKALYVFRSQMNAHFSPRKAFRTFCRARISREVTVPTGIDNVSAISL